MATTLDGKVAAAAIQREVAAEAEALHHERGVTPTLAVVLVGRDPVSKVYITPDLGSVTRQADVLVVVAGRARMVTTEHVRAGAAIVDVAINRMPDGSLAGDVDLVGVSAIAGSVTPVPGGVGPTTVAMLMRNTVRACRRQMGG